MMRLVFAVCAALCFTGNTDAGCRGYQAGCQGHQAKATGCVGAQASCYGGIGGRFFHREVFRSRGVALPSAQIAPPVNPPQPMPKAAPTVNKVAIFGEVQGLDALDAANAQRAKRGLRPFQRDEGLMVGAQKCAEYRAARRMAGHAPNDFAFLPEGVTAKAAGCSGLEPSWGFQSCCLYENWTYAGAASVKGSDGRIFHHLFVR